MRVTLMIDRDILLAARQIAALEKRSLGQVISGLARQSLKQSHSKFATRNQVPLLRVRPSVKPITTDFIRQLQNELQ
jgi:hypothetical protein